MPFHGSDHVSPSLPLAGERQVRPDIVCFSKMKKAPQRKAFSVTLEVSANFGAPMQVSEAL